MNSDLGYWGNDPLVHLCCLKLIFIELNFHFQEYEAIYLAKLQTPTDHSSGEIYLFPIIYSFVID